MSEHKQMQPPDYADASKRFFPHPGRVKSSLKDCPRSPSRTSNLEA